MKEGENRYTQFNERIMNMERRILDEKYENRSEDKKKKNMLVRIKEKQ